MIDEHKASECPVHVKRASAAPPAKSSDRAGQRSLPVPHGPSVRAAQHVIAEQRAAGWLSLALAHGKTFRYQGLYVTCDAELTHRLLIEREHTRRRAQVYKLVNRLVPGSDGLLFMDGDTWLRHARALLPAFARPNVEQYAQVLYEHTRARTVQWADGAPRADLFADLMRLGADVVVRLATGLDPASAPGARLTRDLIGYKAQTMSARVRLDEFGFRWGKLASVPHMLAQSWELHQRVARLRATVHDVLETRRGQAGSSDDWLARLHTAGFSLPVITDQLNHLYGAFNAVDLVLACAIFELSERPAWPERLRAELHTRLGQRAFPTLDDLAAMPDMNNFLREVLRRYPVAMGVTRRTGAPIESAAGQIPAGSQVLLMLYALHHHPDYWHEPDVFNPDRWRDQPEPRVPGSYVPFLIGPRHCVGRHLAELHVAIVLGTLLRHYDVPVLARSLQMTPYIIPRIDRAIPFVLRRPACEANAQTELERTERISA